MQDTSYTLLDRGHGRRLERFAGVVVARPAPAATAAPALPESAWADADMEFTRSHGWRGTAPATWRVRFGAAVLNLRPAAQGQLGVFPEHARVCDRMDRFLTGMDGTRLRALNLFAHTGLATLRLAAHASVAETVHVDAAPAAVRTARENAASSGLEEAPIRWLRDDAMGFLEREIRRGRKYDIVMADPPAYGRNKKGGEWRLERDLPALLLAAGALLAPERGLFCLTCHSGGWDEETLSATVRRALPRFGKVEVDALTLRAETGGALRCGYAVYAGCNGVRLSR